MNRCKSSFAAAACLLGAAFTIAPVQAQIYSPAGIRTFPMDVQRGTMKVIAPPQVLLNKVPERLAPGVIILGTSNTIVTSGTLRPDTSYVVNYRRDGWGQLKEIWLLTEQEAKAKIVKNNARANTTAQRKPRRLADDGRTAYDDLPSFEQSTGPAPE